MGQYTAQYFSVPVEDLYILLGLLSEYADDHGISFDDLIKADLLLSYDESGRLIYSIRGSSSKGS